MAPHRLISSPLGRRTLLRRSALAGGGLIAGSLLPARAFAQQGAAAVITSDKMRPALPYGVQSGDLMGDRAILWAAADRPARMMVEWATSESFADARKVQGPAALEDSDFTAKLDLAGLPQGQKIHYRVTMVDLADHKLVSEPVAGSFWTPPAARQNIRFVWSGDIAGQGFGINPEWGGMKIYETMRQVEPDFFIHSGDTIYADGPIEAEKKLPEGGVWKNLTTEAKSKVAETLDEFRGNYAYNLMDENLRRFNAEVPMLRAVGRSRDRQQLVPERGPCRGSDEERVQGDQRGAALGARGAGLPGVHAGALGIRRMACGSTGASATAPRSTSSGSTCAAIAGRTAPTARRSRGPRRPSSGRSRSAG